MPSRKNKGKLTAKTKDRSSANRQKSALATSKKAEQKVPSPVTTSSSPSPTPHLPSAGTAQTSPSSVPNSTVPVQKVQPFSDTPFWVYRVAKWWTVAFTALLSSLALGIIAILFGLNSFAPPPLLDVIHFYPWQSFVVGGIVILFSIYAWIISRVPMRAVRKSGQIIYTLSRPLITTTIVSTIVAVISISLLATIILRPVGCPSFLCLPPLHTYNRYSNHDDNIETYFTAQQSTSFALSQDPSSYSLKNLPEKVAAVRIDSQTTEPYTIAFGVHNLQRNQGMFIEQVGLVIDEIVSSPHPLNVWFKGLSTSYLSNPYRAIYNGQSAEATLYGTYIRLPEGHVQLSPDEYDELELQVVSHVEVDMRFHIQVLYRINSESNEQAINVPGTFEVVFSNIDNWHSYQLKEGRLVRM